MHKTVDEELSRSSDDLTTEALSRLPLLFSVSVFSLGKQRKKGKIN